MAKGGNFEREICKELSKWFSEGTRDDIFWRTEGSGARATTRAKKGKKTYGANGDVRAVDPIGDCLMKWLTIELKVGYGNWHVQELIETRQAQPKIAQFYNQVKTDQKNSGSKYVMIIAKKDRCFPLVMVPLKLIKEIKKYLKKKNKKFTPANYFIIKDSKRMKEQMFCCSLGSFLEQVPAMFFRRRTI